MILFSSIFCILQNQLNRGTPYIEMCKFYKRVLHKPLLGFRIPKMMCNFFFESKTLRISKVRIISNFSFSFLQPSEGGNITSSTLRFQPKVEDMGKVLRCRAENPVMPASQIEDTWTLDVNCKFACMHSSQ